MITQTTDMHIAMDIDKQAALLNKKIEKIKILLTDGTALAPAKRQAKEAERAALVQQVQALN